ncbi:MAG: GtrA family protein [Paludibacteraceae bacterium]|nr:GtrA family protein [Paludibacteraceae bacterium]
MKLQKFITNSIDFFYTPFRPLMSVQMFRYGVCGVANMMLDWVLYFLSYNFVLQKKVLDFGFVAFTPHIGSLVISFPITFFTGFLLSKYISFQQSALKWKTQLLRYLMVVLGCLLINYVCLKLFVEICHFYPTPSKMITTIFTVLFSYFSQKNFSFKK